MTSHDLLLRIRNAIGGFMDGTVDFEAATREYALLLGEYERLARGLEEGNSYTGGIHYHHNIENFCKLSALYAEEEGDIRLISSAGDDRLLVIVHDVLRESRGGLAMDEAGAILVEKKDVLTYNLHVFPFRKDRVTYYAAAVSSSHYFSAESFLRYGTILRDLYSETVRKPLFFSYGDDPVPVLEECIASHQGEDLFAAIYVFDTIDNIFGHMSAASLMDIAERIIELLRGEYGAGAAVIAFSFTNYIVLYAGEDKKKLRPHFIINNNTVTYKSLHLSIEKDEPVLSFLERLYSFEDYVLRGEALP